MGDQDAAGAGLLLYLFADAEIPADTAMTRGVPVPCTESRVQRTALAQEILAITLWSLYDSGAVSLRHEERKRKLRGTRHVALVAATAGMASSASPLDAGLFDACGVAEAEVLTVTYGWFRIDVSDPAGTVIGAVEDEALQAGLSEPSDAGRIRKALGSRLGAPNCDAIAALRPRFDRMIDRWRQFKTAEPALYAAMIDGIKRAISRRVDSDGYDFD